MVKAIAGTQTPEVRADALVVGQGFAIFILSLVMIQISVPAAVSIPAILALSAISWYRWFERRSQAMTFATV